MDDVSNPFPKSYAFVLTTAVYAGVWFTCFYWPSFVGYLVFPEEIARIETVAGVLILPLGLIGIGAVSGWKTALLHFVIALAALGAALGFLIATGHDADIDFARRILMLAVFIAYIICCTLAIRRKYRLASS